MYAAYPMRAFEKAIKKFDPQQKHKIQNAIKRLEEDPYLNDSWYYGNMRGKHKKYVMNKKLRVVFAICAECRKFNHVDYNACIDCDKHPDNTIKLFEALKRGDDYR